MYSMLREVDGKLGFPVPYSVLGLLPLAEDDMWIWNPLELLESNLGKEHTTLAHVRSYLSVSLPDDGAQGSHVHELEHQVETVYNPNSALTAALCVW